jgi:hypothetical protein
MNDVEANRIIWKEARRYLNKQNKSDEVIDLHLNLYQQVIPNSINDVYFRLLASLINRQGVNNWIGDIENLAPFFEDYSPTKVLAKYQDWEKLIDTINASDFEAPAAINKNDTRNIWVHFSKGSIDGAKFLSKYETHKDFDNFASKYITNNQHVQLATKISLNIHGIGFALACDFLKELGYSDYVKPDVHIIDIFQELGLTKSKKPEDVFTAVLNFAESIDEIPYRVDKMFWLIGSGYFYLLPNKPRIPTDRTEFCRHTRNVLKEQGYEVNYTPSTKKKEIKSIDLHQADFKHLNEMLTELRRLEKISPHQYRDYAKRWREHKDLRNDLIQELSIILSQ